MLHLRLRGPSAELIDLLLTDASGEWFKNWSVDEAGSLAQGARWIVNHADTFLLFVDCARLSGPPETLGGPFGETVRLAERLRDHVGGRRVAIVWAKADQELPTRIRHRLEELFQRFFPGHGSFEVTVNAVRDDSVDRLLQYLQAVDWVAESRAAGLNLPDLAPDADDSFLQIGAR